MPFTKITEADLQGKGVQGQPDVPGLPAAEMQRKVEEIVREVTNVAFNRLVEELLADTAAENIGAKLDGMSAGRTLQAVLAELNTRQSTHAQKNDNPHAVTAAQAGAYTKQETDDAIDKKVQAIGAADMSRAEFAQPGEYGVVKEAKTAQTLHGKPPEYYMPVGTVVPFSGTALPDGWLWCGGNAISRTTYSKLFAVIGTTYGDGDGNSTFHLPDLRGRVVAMRGDSESVGDTAGADTKKIARANLPAEKLKIANDGSWTVDTTQFGVHSGKPLNLGNTRSDAEYLYTEPMGSGTAFDVRQATIYLNYIIKY